jgi:hypothetical protein
MPDRKEDAGAVLERPLATERRHGELLRKLPSHRDRKRAENRARHSQAHPPYYEREFQCECEKPDCQVRLPLDVERHRRRLNRFIVAIGHAGADAVVGVADRFFIVEVYGASAAALRQPEPAAARSEVSAA